MLNLYTQLIQSQFHKQTFKWKCSRMIISPSQGYRGKYKSYSKFRCSYGKLAMYSWRGDQWLLSFWALFQRLSLSFRPIRPTRFGLGDFSRASTGARLSSSCDWFILLFVFSANQATRDLGHVIFPALSPVARFSSSSNWLISLFIRFCCRFFIQSC